MCKYDRLLIVKYDYLSLTVLVFLHVLSVVSLKKEKHECFGYCLKFEVLFTSLCLSFMWQREFHSPNLATKIRFQREN